MVDAALFAKQKTDWETPPEIFNPLHQEFDFTLDPCATAKNAKCEHYYTKRNNGLRNTWAPHRVFLNPPYGRDIGLWMAKAVSEETLVVALLPVRTDTRWWHEWVIPHATEVRFLRGRVRFIGGTSTAPFPSAVAIYKPDEAPITWQ